MKTKTFALALGVTLLALPACAEILIDGIVEGDYGAPLATDDALPTAGEGGPDGTAILDVTNLYVSDNGTTLSLALEVAGDIAATDWGKYIIAINSPAITGTSTTVAWGRNVTLTSNFQVSTWVDFGGGTQFHRWDNGGSSWTSVSTGVAAAIGNGSTPGVIEAAVALSELGSPAQVEICAFSSGGGGTDPATDIVPGTNGNTASWGDSSTITVLATYNISPASVADWYVHD